MPRVSSSRQIAEIGRTFRQIPEIGRWKDDAQQASP